MTQDLKEQVTGQFRGVFPKSNLPKDALLFIPLSPDFYTVDMNDDAMEKLLAALKEVEKLDVSPRDKMELLDIILEQVKKMALFGPLREKLFEQNAIATVASAIMKCPFSEEGAGHAASLLSNMTIYTFKHHPGSKKLMEQLEPHLDSLLDCLRKILGQYSYVPVVMHATAYALENISAHPVSCAYLLQPENPRSDRLLDFVIKNARGETEAQNSPIAKKCADAMDAIVANALLSSGPVPDTILPGVSDENALRMLDTMFKWHIEYYPWSWAHRPAISQMMPHLLNEYAEVRNAFTTTLQKWSMHSAFGGAEGVVDATGKTPDARPRVWDELAKVARSIHDLPPSQCYVKIENAMLRVAMFSVAPSPEIAYEFMAEPLPQQ